MNFHIFTIICSHCVWLSKTAYVTAWVPCAISQKLLRFLGCLYVCISPNLPRFHGPGIEALKLYSTRVDRFRKKYLSLEMNKKYPKDHDRR